MIDVTQSPRIRLNAELTAIDTPTLRSVAGSVPNASSRPPPAANDMATVAATARPLPSSSIQTCG